MECVDFELLGEPSFCRPGVDGCDEDGNGLKLLFPDDGHLYRKQPVDKQLISLHAAIVRTWVATGEYPFVVIIEGNIITGHLLQGQLPRHVEDCRCLRTILPRYQHYSALGERNFHNILTHILTLV